MSQPPPNRLSRFRGPSFGKNRRDERRHPRLQPAREAEDNAAIESFNGRFREECLNVHWFASVDDARQKIDAFRWDYNENHPHRALKGLSPREYGQRAMVTAASSPS